MESARGTTDPRAYAAGPYSPAAALPSLFRPPPLKYQPHRPFEDHVIVRLSPPVVQVDSLVNPMASYLQYPDVHSTGLPLLIPPPTPSSWSSQVFVRT